MVLCIPVMIWSIRGLCHRQDSIVDVNIGVDEDLLRSEGDDMLCREAVLLQTESFDHPLPSTEARMSYEQLFSW